jgi:hypothetical protein
VLDFDIVVSAGQRRSGRRLQRSAAGFVQSIDQQLQVDGWHHRSSELAAFTYEHLWFANPFVQFSLVTSVTYLSSFEIIA